MELFIDINNQLFYNLQKYQLKSTQQAKQHHDTLHSIQPTQYNSCLSLLLQRLLQFQQLISPKTPASHASKASGNSRAMQTSRKLRSLP